MPYDKLNFKINASIVHIGSIGEATWEQVTKSEE